MTQIKLLVIMPVPDGERGDDGSSDVPFTDHVNATMAFGDGWRLHANQADYAGADADGYGLGGAADEPPVKAAIECLAKAAAPKGDRQAENKGDGETEQERAGDGGSAGAKPGAAEEGTAKAGDGGGAPRARTHGEVLEFEVPEGSTSVQARVKPEVSVEGDELHVRVRVDDPGWVKESDTPD
jgi:hypothetical protein